MEKSPGRLLTAIESDYGGAGPLPEEGERGRCRLPLKVIDPFLMGAVGEDEGSQPVPVAVDGRLLGKLAPVFRGQAGRGAKGRCAYNLELTGNT